MATKGSQVVDEVVKKIQDSGIFPDDKGFLRRIARVESRDGEDPNTYRAGYYGGIWQVDKIGFDDTQDTRSHPGLTSKFEKIKKSFDIQWSSVKWQNLVNPLHSGLAARLYLSNQPGAIPADLDGQAQYWKDHYNKSGKGTKEKFIERAGNP